MRDLDHERRWYLQSDQQILIWFILKLIVELQWPKKGSLKYIGQIIVIQQGNGACMG